MNYIFNLNSNTNTVKVHSLALQAVGHCFVPFLLYFTSEWCHIIIIIIIKVIIWNRPLVFQFAAFCCCDLQYCMCMQKAGQ